MVSDLDLKRQVAMKVLRLDAGGGREARLPFNSEAQATSQLEHPGIPPVHDIGKAAGPGLVRPARRARRCAASKLRKGGIAS